jgi:hypothetical protein
VKILREKGKENIVGRQVMIWYCENKPCLLAFPIIKGYFSYDHKYTAINHDMHFFFVINVYIASHVLMFTPFVLV